MRIVFIRSNPVAPYPRLEKTVNSLVKNGHSAHVLGWDRSCKYKEKKDVLILTDSEVEITRFGIPATFGGGMKSNLIGLMKFQFRIFKWLLKNRKSYDAIHAYDFDTGFISLKCAKLLNKKIIYDIPDYYVDSHNLKGSRIGKYIEKQEYKIINNSDATIICTEKRKEQIRGSKPKKLVIIHNSPKRVNIIANDMKDSLKTKIVYVGILANSRFIKEIADVVIKRNDCEFHVGGFGKLESYFKQLSEKYNNIKFYGKIPYESTLKLEKECDIMVAIYDPNVPNHFYAAPNKFYESLMLGKPIIMAKNTGMDDVVLNNDIGEVIEYSIDSLELAIEKLIARKKEWPDMANRSKKLYTEKFSWDTMEKRLVSLYDEIEKERIV